MCIVIENANIPISAYIFHLYTYRISCIYKHVIIIVAHAKVSEEDIEYWYPAFQLRRMLMIYYMWLRLLKTWFSSHWLFQFTLFAFLISKWIPHGQMINCTIIHCGPFLSYLCRAPCTESVWNMGWHYKLQPCIHTALIHIVSALPLETPIPKVLESEWWKYIFTWQLA